MAAESQTMPLGAVAVAMPVMIYTIFCLACGILLVGALVMNKDRSSYVFLIAVSTTLSALTAIVQQSNNIANWRELQVVQYRLSVLAYGDASIALGPLATGFTAWLYWTQAYLFTVNGLLLLFWAMALVVNVWNWQTGWLQPHVNWIGITSKVVAIVVPIIAGIVRRCVHFHGGLISTLILYNSILLFSLPLTIVCIVLILSKYLRSRFGFETCPSGSQSGISEPSDSAWAKLKLRVDPWLLVRFLVAWFLVTGFEIVLIYFCIDRYYHVKDTAEMAGPDFTIRSTIDNILVNIPAPTETLLAFSVFGTTAPLRARYRSILRPLKCWSKNHPNSPNIDRATSQEWSRMTSRELREDQRFEIRNGQLEPIRVDEKLDAPKALTEVVYRQDIESLAESEEETGHASRRCSSA